MKKNIKVYIKKFIRIIAFVLAFVLIIEVLSLTVFSKQGAAGYENKFAKAYSFTQEPKNSIQIGCIGNSDLYSGFVPNELWQTHGYTSTVSAAPRVTPHQAYEMLVEMLKYQKPQVLIIETDMLYSSAPEIKNVVSSEKSTDALFDYFNTDNFSDLIESQFTIFSFHDKWKNIILNKKPKLRTPSSHGYRYSNNTRHLQDTKYMFETTNYEKVSVVNVNYIRDMITLCKNNNIEVMLVELPSVTSWNYERHNATERIAKSNNVKFYDLNLAMDDVNINICRDFRDMGNHLNYKGAKKATRYIGDIIKSEYTLTDRRKDSKYSYWDDSCKEFKKERHQDDLERKNSSDNTDDIE